MSKFLMLLLFIPITKIISGQENSIATIDYQFIHHSDTSNRDKVHKEVLRLIFSTKLSKYFSQSKFEYDNIMAINLPKQAAAGRSLFKINLGKFATNTTEEFYNEYENANIFTYRKFLQQGYLITDTTKIRWQILNDTGIVIGYPCQKAITHFKGRDYIVWFTSKLAYPVGPWKLHGLPGVILKAVDTKNDVYFEALSISSSSYALVELPKDCNKISNQNFNKMLLAYRENPEAFQSENSIRVVSKTQTPVKKVKANNPVELPEAN